MKNVLLLLVFVTWFATGWAQETSLNLDFSDPAHADRFTPIIDPGGEFVKTVSDGEMKLELNKTEWHFLQVWVKPFDFVNNPYLSFRIKSDKDTPVRIWVKQENGNEKVLFDQTISAGADYQNIALSFDNVSPLNGDLQELGMELGGYQVPPATFAATVYLDDFRLGAAAKPASSISLDFTDPADADKFNFIFDSGGELTKSVAGGEMKLELNKKEWHFFQLFLESFDFIKNPYLSFKIKANQATPVRIWVKQPNDGPDKELFNQTIEASADYQTIQLAFDNTTPLTGNIQELGMDIGGYQVPPAVFTGTVFMDEFKLGEAAKPPVAVYGTGYSEDFSSDLYAGWAQGEGYTLSKEGEALKIAVSRSTPVKDTELQKLPSLSFEDKVLDISANPYLNLDINGRDPFTLSVLVLDNFKTLKEHRIRVVPTGKYQTISLNLSTIPGLDLSKVEKLYFDFNRDGFAFRTTVLVDRIQLGDQAGNLAIMDAIPDKKYYKNSGTKEILLTHIENATAITVTSAPTLVENVSVSPIANGMATLTFDVKANQVGEENIALTVTGAEGYADNTYTFGLTVEDNFSPTLDSIADVELKAWKEVTIDLSGISDGNSTVEQPLTFTVTSTNNKIISGKVVYSGEGPYATLHLKPRWRGTAVVTVTVTDAGDVNNSKSISFEAAIFNSLNTPPTIAAVPDLEAYQDAGPSTLALTGISGGDKSEEELTFTVSNSNPAIVTNVSIDYDSGEQAVLHYEPVADTTGTSTITVTVADDGGNRRNNGDRSTTITFVIEVVKRPVTGYVATLQKSVEVFGGNEKYTITEVDSAGFKALVFQATDKGYWDGVLMNLPQELDLSENPYLTMEVFPVGQNTLHWIWFYDAAGNRNDLNNREGAHIQRPEAGKWNKLVFDFSGENDWIGGGQPINNKRITRVLFDMHNSDFVWPPPANYTGTFIVRNIRIGSAADIQVDATATVNAVANQVAFPSATGQTVRLSGISNGRGSSAGTTVSITNSNPAVVLNPTISAVDTSGAATLTYSTGASTGKSTITLTVAADSAASTVVSFDIDVLTAVADSASVVTIDVNQKFQKMYGFGTFSTSSIYNEIYTDLMGGTAMRVGLIENQLEPVNDNDDPNVLNMEGLNYGAFDWNYYRDLKARGVESFILSSWSPPAWMKTNLSLDYKAPGYARNTDETTNRLDYTMYEEFAESMVAAVKAFKQRAGIDLLAIGLQNEPMFHEPYPSAILDPAKFAQLIKVVGRRFEKEGITTRLYFAEQVSGSPDNAANFFEDNHNYIKAIKADPEADKYADIFAIHGYGSDGITPGQPKYEAWESYRDSVSTGNNPKDVWMTETHKDYNSWQDALDISGAIFGALQYGDVSLWTQWGFEGQMARQGKATPMLYAMSNFAKFIRPGHVRIGTSTTNNDVLATSFVDEATGKISIVLVNKAATPISVKFAGQGLGDSWKMYNTAENRNLEEMTSVANGIFLLPARSVTTLVNFRALQMDSIANVKVKAGSLFNVVTVTGIKNSQGNTEGLHLTLSNSNTAVVPIILASRVNEDGTAFLVFATSRKAGTSTINVQLSDEAGNQLSRSFQIQTGSSNAKVGVESIVHELHVSPNPSNGVFALESDESGTAEIVDVTGRVVFTTPVENGNQTVRATGLKAGVYIITVRTPQGVRIARMAIK